VKVVVDRRRISIVDFDDGREFFRRHQDLVLVIDDASEIDAPNKEGSGD
jgi:hypothetical protein